MRATDKQIWLIKKLGRERGFYVNDESDMNHVLQLVGRTHWASLKVYEASKLIDLLKQPETKGGLL